MMMAGFAVIGLLSVELFKTNITQKMYKEKLRAAKQMESAINILSQKRAEVTGHIDLESDPARSGLIGQLMSDITSTSGHLQAKQTSINPNWAAVMVELFRRAKLKKGDTVALGLSGSFPALNLATFMAAESMGLKVISIVGVSASMWGANVPEFTWLDMEGILAERQLISRRTVAASLGGVGDRARGISAKGRGLLKAAIDRHRIHLITSKTPELGLAERMEIYKREAGEEPIKAYVNVGGNTLSVGSMVGKKLYRSGLNMNPSADALSIDCVMTRFARENIPVIHMIRVHGLADRFGLPLSPLELPKVGEGKIFTKAEYNINLVLGVLISLLGLLYIFMKSDIGYRILYSGEVKEGAKPPTPMV